MANTKTHRTHSWKTERRVGEMRDREKAVADAMDVDVPRFADRIVPPRKAS